MYDGFRSFVMGANGIASDRRKGGHGDARSRDGATSMRGHHVAFEQRDCPAPSGTRRVETLHKELIVEKVFQCIFCLVSPLKMSRTIPR
jgi:hypothetical protein